MHLKKVNSNVLEAIGYDPTMALLEVKFKISGRIYGFWNVAKYEYEELLNSKSKGHYFNKFIKQNYPSILLK